jgi:hypothetical protein
MIRDIYDVSFNRTTDQTNMALWWNDWDFIGYTSGPYHECGEHGIEQEHRDLITSIQVNAKAGMALWMVDLCFGQNTSTASKAGYHIEGSSI